MYPQPDTPVLPTMGQLGKASGIALAAAAVILAVAVLPAEYGIDPLGAGRVLGLTKLNQGGAKPADVLPAAGVPAGAAATSLPVVKSGVPMRADEMTVTLQPGQGTEIKARMKKGERFVFSWNSQGGPVKSDMHGEPEPAKPNEFTTYWKEAQQSGAQGTFTAGFDGIHGWFWRNKTDHPVTITVKLSGFYEKMFRAS
jgi:hypothetical protein